MLRVTDQTVRAGRWTNIDTDISLRLYIRREKGRSRFVDGSCARAEGYTQLAHFVVIHLSR